MRSCLLRRALAVIGLLLPAGAMAGTAAGLHQQAGILAALLWLAALGWGFHAMLRGRLAAEDRLARLESDISLERDNHAMQWQLQQQRQQTLLQEWQRFEDCLADGDRRRIQSQSHIVHSAIAHLQQ